MHNGKTVTDLISDLKGQIRHVEDTLNETESKRDRLTEELRGLRKERRELERKVETLEQLM